MNSAIEAPLTKHCGRYRGVYFEINEPLEYWKFTYYIHLVIDKITDKQLAENSWEQKGYMECEDMYRNIDLHGGCTFTKHCVDYTANKEYRKIVIGCDYSHLQDRDIVYTLNKVINDVRISIDSVHERIGYKEDD